MKIVRMKLAPGDVFPVNQRYNSDCDCIQATPDGGATWVDSPQFDPRTSPGKQQPPYPSDDPACDAAASIVANMRTGLNMALDELDALVGVAAVATSLLQFLDFLDGIGLLYALITALVAGIVDIGTTAIREAFTDDVWDQLHCIFYCHCSPDGTFTAAQFLAIENQVSDVFGSTSVVNLIVGFWLEPLGNVGLGNVAALKHVTGDCTDCTCTWCYEWSSAADLVADGWSHDLASGSDFFEAAFTVELTKISMSFTWDGVGGGGDSAAALWAGSGFTNRVALFAPLAGITSPYEWTGDEPAANGASFGLNAAAGSGGVVAVTGVHLEGIGLRPAWTHGTDCS